MSCQDVISSFRSSKPSLLLSLQDQLRSKCTDALHLEYEDQPKLAMRFAVWLFAVSLSSTCLARDYTFTVKLARGTSECFYDYIHEGAFLEIEYQVREDI